MSQVSRPMQLVLAVAVLFAAVWFVALRPKAADSSATPTAQQAPGVKGLANDIAKAHKAVGTANGAAQRAAGTGSGGASATVPAGSTGTATASTGTTHPVAVKPRTHHGARAHHVARTHAPAHHGTLAGVRLVTRALRQHKAIAVAFINSAVADARAVGVEMHHVGSFHGRAVTLVVPISQLSSYDVITRTVQVTAAPTTVIIAPGGDAMTIVGFTDRNEITQRLANVLAKKR